MASWAAMIIIGRIKRARVKPPASKLLPNPRLRTNISRPKMPYTMEGTPARFAMFIWASRAKRFRAAYSSRYIAVPTPSIKDTRPAIITR